MYNEIKLLYSNQTATRKNEIQSMHVLYMEGT